MIFLLTARAAQTCVITGQSGENASSALASYAFDRKGFAKTFGVEFASGGEPFGGESFAVNKF